MNPIQSIEIRRITFQTRISTLNKLKFLKTQRIFKTAISAFNKDLICEILFNATISADFDL